MCRRTWDLGCESLGINRKPPFYLGNHDVLCESAALVRSCTVLPLWYALATHVRSCRSGTLWSGLKRSGASGFAADIHKLRALRGLGALVRTWSVSQRRAKMGVCWETILPATHKIYPLLGDMERHGRSNIGTTQKSQAAMSHPPTNVSIRTFM